MTIQRVNADTHMDEVNHDELHNDVADAVESVEATATTLTTQVAGIDIVGVGAYGAAGDGVTDDTLAIRAAIATGKHVAFIRGNTYIYSGSLPLEAGQHIYGNGAVLKRAAQVSTTTTTTIAHNVTQAIAVASTTGLYVGQQITIARSDIADLTVNYSPQNYTIASIVGATVTITGRFQVPSSATWTGTTQVFSTNSGIGLNDDCRVYDLEMDGNRSNWTFYRWQNTTEITSTPDGAASALRHSVENCYLHDAPGEGIYLFGDGGAVVGNTIKDANGNGIHFSNGTGLRVERNRIENTNLGGEVVGHQGGCIANSATGDDCIVRGNYLINGKAGLDLNPSGQLIAGNTIRECTDAITMTPGTGAAGIAQRITITGNRMYDSGRVYFAQVDSNYPYPSQVTVSNNELYGTRVYLLRTNNIIISGNTIDLTGDAVNSPVVADASRNLRVSDNTILGGQYGIYFHNTNGDAGGFAITTNTFVNQADTAIYPDLSTGVVENNSGLISGNTVTNDSTSSAGYIGIIAPHWTLTVGNKVMIAKGGYGISAQNDSMVVSNYVVNDSGSGQSISDPYNGGAGGSGAVIMHNHVTTPVANYGGAANTVRDNGETYYDPAVADAALTASMTRIFLAQFGANTPANVPGLLAWFDSTKMVTDGDASSDGDAVAQWTDQGAGTHNAVQATAGSKPLYKTNILNSLPMVRFDGSDDVLVTDSITYGSPDLTIFCVGVVRNSMSQYGKKFYQAGAGAWDGAWLQLNSADPYLMFYHRYSVGGDFALWATYTSALGVGDGLFTTQVAARSLTTGEPKGYLNGVLSGSVIADANNPDAQNVGAAPFYIGSDEGTGNAQVDIGEIIVYDWALTAFERQLVEAYLIDKWGF